MKVPAMKEPKTKYRSSRKLLAFLFIFFITLLIVLFFQSSLSKITEIEIGGNELLQQEEVKQAMPVKVGDHFFATSSASIEKAVGSMRMVESAHVTKRFPGVIHVEVKEFPRVAFQIAEDGKKVVLLADGSAVTIEQKNVTIDKPILTGWAKDDPNKIKLCKVMAGLPASYFSDVSEIKPDPSESYPDKIKLYTRSHFEVNTTIGYLPDKLPYLDVYITNLKENNINTGILKLLEADNHMPFDQSVAKDGGTAGSKDPKSADKKSTTPVTQQDPKKDIAKPPAKDADKPPAKDSARN